MSDLKKVQVLCQYCWNSELNHAMVESRSDNHTSDDVTEFRAYHAAAGESLYETAVMCDRRDLEGETNVSFAKAQAEDLLFSFQAKTNESVERGVIVCYQKRVQNHRKAMRLETLHAVKAVSMLIKLRPKQTVINFCRIIAESLLPSPCTELVIQAVAKEIYRAALAQTTPHNDAA